MKVFYIKVGDKEIGPFTSKGAAVAEAKELRKKGFELTVKERTESETALFEFLGNPEADVDLDIDLDNDDDDDAGADDDDDAGADDDDDAGADDDDDDKPKRKPKKKADDDDDDADDKPDDKPEGAHPWFSTFGKGSKE